MLDLIKAIPGDIAHIWQTRPAFRMFVTFLAGFAACALVAHFASCVAV